MPLLLPREGAKRSKLLYNIKHSRYMLKICPLQDFRLVTCTDAWSLESWECTTVIWGSSGFDSKACRSTSLTRLSIELWRSSVEREKKMVCYISILTMHMTAYIITRSCIIYQVLFLRPEPTLYYRKDPDVCVVLNQFRSPLRERDLFQLKTYMCCTSLKLK